MHRDSASPGRAPWSGSPPPLSWLRRPTARKSPHRAKERLGYFAVPRWVPPEGRREAQAPESLHEPRPCCRGDGLMESSYEVVLILAMLGVMAWSVFVIRRLRDSDALSRSTLESMVHAVFTLSTTGV